ncbi:MAG: DUF6531 domain-containing protein [Thiobacillus sp.]
MFSRHFVFALSLGLLGLSSGAQSAPELIAPLPADVVDKLLREPHSQLVDGLAAELAQRLDEAEDIVTRWEKELATGQRDGATVDRAAQMQGQAGMINALKESALGRLGQEKNRVMKAAASKKSGQALGHAHSLRADRVAKAFDSLDVVMKAVLAAQPAERAQALAKARTVLRQLRGNQRDRELAPSGTPWPTHRLGEKVGPSPHQKSDSLPRYLSEQQSRYQNSVASTGTIMLAAAPATPGEAGQCYTGGAVDSADLAATPDAQTGDAEIQALAEKLAYSPAKILAWVHDNIKYEPYWGSLKGAKGALVSGAGNATDQSSLMIALLRASNIPARYVTGNIQIRDSVSTQPGGRALRWLGAKTYIAAASILGRIPGATYLSNGVGIEHVWVQACVPYTHYRGAALSNAGHRWIPLDAAFKDKAYRQDIDVNVSFNYTFNSGDYLAARTDELPHERYARQVESALLPLDKDTSDLSPEGAVKTMKLDILPTSLPYEVVNFVNLTGASSAEPSALPASHRYVFDVTVKNSAGTVLLSRNVTYPDASLKRLTLSFAPSDAASQTWWNSWNGSFATLPAGSGGVNVRPVIKLEGSEVAGAAAGTSLLTGGNLTLILKLRLTDNNYGTNCPADSGSGKDPDTTCANKTVYTNIKPGAYHALQAYAFQGSDRYIKERSAQLIAAVRSNAAPTPANPAAYEATLGEFLHLSLVKYLRYGQDATKQIGEAMNISGRRGNDIGLTTVDLKTEYLLDQPYAIKTGGLLIDVGGGLTLMTKLDTTATDGATQRNEIWPAFKLALYTGSAFEHYIWQEMARTDAVSTVRGLQFAKETGDTIVTLNASNIGSWSSLMDVSMNPYQAQIAAYVSQGATITVPRRSLAYLAEGSSQTWNGAVYMAENQGAGSFGAIISGNFGGGWGAPIYTPLSTNYYFDTYTPALLTAPTTSFFSYTNSTTSALGYNPYQTTAGDPVNMVTGNFYHVERDLSIPGRGGLPLVFERSYNSRKPANGTLGWGWTHSFNHSLRFYGVESSQAKVSWIDGTGGEKFFAASAADTNNLNGKIKPNAVALLNSPGIFVTFKREVSGEYTIREKNGLTYTFESIDSGKTDAGLKAKLLSIKDRNNNTLALAYNGDATLKDITDGPGRKLAFTYASGRITRLDFSKVGGAVVRSHEYTYDDAGNLASHKSPATLIDPVKSPAVQYQYYAAADGANLDHAMKQSCCRAATA